MPGPVFQDVFVLGAAAAPPVLKHGSTQNDRGWLYGRVSAGPTLDLFADTARTVDRRVATGGAAVGTPFALASVNASGLTGLATIDLDTPADFLVVPSFAADIDVAVNPLFVQQLPGFDSTYGLSYLHAEAHRDLLTLHLPGVIPHLFGGLGMANFVPADPGSVLLPDLKRMASIDQLRAIQARLVKHKSATQAEHLAEFAKIRDDTWTWLERALLALGAANTLDEQIGIVAEVDNSSYSVGEWQRN
jgi:hypothetical protein